VSNAATKDWYLKIVLPSILISAVGCHLSSTASKHSLVSTGHADVITFLI
jgi:hypothetical protein